MKALVGSWDTRPTRVLAELTSLRARVAELHRELDAARDENAALREALAELQTSELSLDRDLDVLTAR
jgi:hypothetical protein